MRSKMRAVSAAAAGVAGVLGLADLADAAPLPAWAPELIMSDRNNAFFNLPANTTIVTSNTGLALGDGKHVAFKVRATGSGDDVLWYGQGTSGASVAQTTSNSLLVGFNGIAGNGTLAFASNNGVTLQPSNTLVFRGVYAVSGTNFTTVASDHVAYSTPRILNDGSAVGLQMNSAPGTNTKVLRRYDLPGATFVDYAAMSGSTPTPGTNVNLLAGSFTRGSAFLGFNSSTGSLPLIRWNADGTVQQLSSGTNVAAVGGDGNAAGQAVYVTNGNFVSPNVRILRTSNGASFDVVAAPFSGPLGAINTAVPAQINGPGLVAFVANQAGGTNAAVWVTDGVDTAKVVGVGDVLPTANGTARVSSLGGGVFDINDNGDVAVVVQFGDADGGSGVYLFNAPEPGGVAMVAMGLGGLLLRRRGRGS